MVTENQRFGKPEKNVQETQMRRPGNERRKRMIGGLIFAFSLWSYCITNDLKNQ